MDWFSERNGELVRLDGSKPALNQCRFCGNGEGRLSEPKGPHGCGVRCTSCERHLGWLPRPKVEPAEDIDLIEH